MISSGKKQMEHSLLIFLWINKNITNVGRMFQSSIGQVRYLILFLVSAKTSTLDNFRERKPRCFLLVVIGPVGGAMDYGRVPGSAQKKIIIRNFKGPRKLPQNYENDTWVMLEEAVKEAVKYTFFIDNV